MRCFRIALATTTVLSCLWAAAAPLSGPTQEWSYKSEHALGTSPIPYPSDKPNSVIIATGGRVLRISGAGELIYDVAFGPEEGRGGISEPSLGDLDGDGKDELLLGHKAGWVFAADPDTGKIRWEFNLRTPLDTWQMPTPADLDGDGKAEVIAPSLYGWIYCLNGDGTLRWRSRVEEYRPSVVNVGDINHDGRPEIVYGTATRYLIALDADGRLLWKSFQPPLHLGRCKPLIADLDNDGHAEIYSLSSMISPDTGLVSVDGATGQTRWTGATWHKAYNGRNLMRFTDGTQGIVIADKGNNVAAYQADGTMRWRTRMTGRGIWTPPTVADLDGDGAHEIVANIRGVSRDGEGNSWYVLSTEGDLLGAFPHSNDAFGAAAVADIDQDSALELVLASSSGQITAYSFGGAATEEAIVAGHWDDAAYTVAPDRITPREAAPAPTAITGGLVRGQQYGAYAVEAQVREGSLSVLDVTLPDGTREVTAKSPDAGFADFMIPAFESGEYRLSFSTFNPTTGVTGDRSGRSFMLDNLNQALHARVTDVQAYIRDALQAIQSDPAASENVLLLKSRAQALEARWHQLKTRCNVRPANRDARLVLEQDVESLRVALPHERRLVDQIMDARSASRLAAFALWQDKDPWDNVPPTIAYAEDESGPFDLWAFGNEIESVCVNISNLTSRGITLRVEPGSVTRVGDDKPMGPARDHTTLHRAVWLPSVFEEVVPDVLPKLGEGYLIDIAPGEVQQLWINVNTAELEPGAYTIEWPVRTLDAASTTLPLTVNFTVSPVRLPEESKFLAGYWSKNQLGDLSTVADLNEHLQTIWYQLPLPRAEADAEGNLVGEIDWSTLDGYLSEIKQLELMLNSGVPVPKFPEGVTPSDELKMTAQRNYIDALFEHLGEFDLGPDNFMLYVEDEPGLNGEVDNYIERAKQIRELDPRLQTYANPWGAITTELIHEMEPLTDIWQPGMETIEFHGPDYVAAMRGDSNKPISMYTPPSNCRVLRPLGFFRSQPWIAYHWTIEGGGWWVYWGGADLFATTPDQEPNYGGVNWDGRSIVTSRRWEAMRDGVEDFNALHLLRDALAKTPDAAGQQALDDAVAYVAGRAITGMPREAADYELDFATLSEHRLRIREALERLVR
jgi:outer membrane protein assembly factor BamB